MAEKGSMATKVRIMKMLQEIRGLADVTNRRPPPRSPALFLIQLRSHLQNTTQPRRKLIVCTEDPLEQHDVPSPVKITHVPAGPTPPVNSLWSSGS